MNRATADTNQKEKNIDLAAKINQLKKEKNAVLLAHFYQVPEIQDIADYTGDSLGLAQQAAQTDADMIVFAGVHFMAETAKILSPGKTVVLPDMEAGCSLADSCPPDQFKAFKEKYPGHMVISYINCSAAIKTMSDVICTSGNVGGYINRVTGRNMVLWDGTCEVHDVLTTESIVKMKAVNPEAKLVAHPECQAPVLELADFVGSTSAMLKYVKKDDTKKFIVATESGILHQMKKDSPDKDFLIVSKDETCACNDCPYMKMNTMQKLYLCMKNERPQIHLSDEVIEKAHQPIERMMEISRMLGLV